jgi:hypothetical protein
MRLKVKGLSLVEAPRVAGESTVLISRPGCVQQQLHTDFDPARVKQLLKEDRLVGVPLSVLCSFTPGGSALVIQDASTGQAKEIHLDFGAMAIFTGDVIHSGAKYSDFNVRGFFHITHEELCPHVEDKVYFPEGWVGVDAATAGAVPLTSVPESTQPNVAAAQVSPSAAAQVSPIAAAQVSPIAAARVEPATRKRSRRIGLTAPNTRSRSNGSKGAAIKYV